MENQNTSVKLLFSLGQKFEYRFKTCHSSIHLVFLWETALTRQKNPEILELRLLINKLYLNKPLIWLYPH